MIAFNETYDAYMLELDGILFRWDEKPDASADSQGESKCATAPIRAFDANDPFDVEDDPRACEPEYVKELCDELRRRDLIPPKLLPEEWSRYLDIRQKRLNDGTYGLILPEDE